MCSYFSTILTFWSRSWESKVETKKKDCIIYYYNKHTSNYNSIIICFVGIYFIFECSVDRYCCVFIFPCKTNAWENANERERFIGWHQLFFCCIPSNRKRDEFIKKISAYHRSAKEYICIIYYTKYKVKIANSRSRRTGNIKASILTTAYYVHLRRI